MCRPLVPRVSLSLSPAQIHTALHQHPAKHLAHAASPRRRVIELLPAGIQLLRVSLHLDTDKVPEEQGREEERERGSDKELARRDG